MIYYSQQLPSRTLITEHQNYLWFSGTSYLGIPHQPEFRANFLESIAHYGTSWGSSRNNTVRLSIYEEAENILAQWVNAPAALTVSSGMWAGQLVLNFLQNQENSIWYAPKTHPALWGKNYATSTNHDWTKGLSYREWTLSIADKIAQSDEQHIVICSDSVGSPYVEHFDFEWINQLPTHKNITIVIDASHSLGVSPSIYPTHPNHTIIVTASLNKAMGMTGGVIFSDDDTLNKIRQFPMFSGASPMMPALLDSFVKSLAIYQSQAIKLQQNIADFNTIIKGNTSLDFIENYPAYCTHEIGLHDLLKQNGIMTACFPYPTATDLPVTRLVISALHSKSDLFIVGEIINSCR
jgi:7-keto-8-aminopelargonate synthetase-like enzyme